MPGRGQNRAAAFPRHAGWWRDGVNNRLVAVFDGTEIFDFDGNDVVVAQATTFSGALTASGVQTASAESRIAEGFNLRLGTISTFATTEPTNTVVWKVGTNPVGAITTSGAIFVTTGGATISKIIADGTVSTVQT
jgi:hypothetical protein